MKHLWFWQLQEVAANRILMVSNLQEVVVKPFNTFTMKHLWFWKLQEAVANLVLMVLNFHEVAVKPFTHIYNETFMVLEAS